MSRAARFHLVFGQALDLDHEAREARAGLRPAHVMNDVRDALGAQTHNPDAAAVRPADRLWARLISQPEHWALARRLAGALDERDVVFCNGEDVGIPLAMMCRSLPRERRPRIAIFFHTANRPRVRAMLAVFRLRDVIRVFVSNTHAQFEQLQATVGALPEERRLYLREQIDTGFFSPGPASAGKRRPLIASAGLEKRDYRLLAAATAHRDVDVRISGFSRNVPPLRKSFPPQLPANMSRGFCAWPALRQRYRDADLVVIPLFPSLDSAGVTTLMEAWACACPVIVTRTRGLDEYLVDRDGVVPIAPGDGGALQAAIDALLADPAAARRLGWRAHRRVLAQHASAPYVQVLADLMRRMAG